MEIRFFKKTEKSLLMQSIHSIWANNHILSRDENLLNHMFYETPGHKLITDREHFSFLGAWDDNKVIGLLGVMPFPFNFNGRKSLGCCLTNWIVSPEARATGAGLALIDKVHSFKPDMILSLGVSNEGSKVYKLMRWDVQPDVPRWIGLINKNRTVSALLGGESQPLRYYDVIKPLKYEGTYTVEHNDKLNETDWDAFYSSNYSKKSVGINRNAEFFKWRYENHPSFDYKFVICKCESNIKGLMVYRIEKLKSGDKIGRIVECITSDQDSAISLANALTDNQDLLFYDFYCFSNSTTWGLEAIGFKKVYKSEQDLYTIPSRFQPVDLENTDMLAAVFFSDKIKNKWNSVVLDSLYITKADSDQDRPN
ncbi:MULTISPECIES: GNAT family N-acetyltransferase [Lysinibacillus]|uniref:GNAT family N-acetyltransferase n=1 Tax=Lysinibacillus TaxID=400634 RepID=UPI00257A9A77|nr:MULTISPECIES: GNAT family N-acetyltransferase [Lysinibacillus]